MPTFAAAVQRPSQPPLGLAALTLAESGERAHLREALRVRRSVDHFARFWYGSLVSLIATGVAVKLGHDAIHLRWYHLPVALALVGLYSFALTYGVRTLRTARAERGMLARLRSLDARAPPPPELF